MDTFVDYYNASKKDFQFTIKMADNDVPDEVMEKLKTYLERYNLKSMSPVKKTPIQKSPLDFPNLRNCEVYITEIVLEYPITPDALLREVSQVTSLSEQSVAIYTENDPRRQYEVEWNERMVDNDKFVADYEPKLGNPEKWDTEPAYGEEYNTPFLKSLSDQDFTKQETVTNDLIPDSKFDKETVQGEEKGKVNSDPVLTDLHRNKNAPVQKSKNTLMSKPAKEGKK